MVSRHFGNDGETAKVVSVRRLHKSHLVMVYQMHDDEWSIQAPLTNTNQKDLYHPSSIPRHPTPHQETSPKLHWNKSLVFPRLLSLAYHHLNSLKFLYHDRISPWTESRIKDPHTIFSFSHPRSTQRINPLLLRNTQLPRKFHRGHDTTCGHVHIVKCIH